MAWDHRLARGRGPELMAMDAPAAVGHGPVKSSRTRSLVGWKSTSPGSRERRSTTRVTAALEVNPAERGARTEKGCLGAGQQRVRRFGEFCHHLNFLSQSCHRFGRTSRGEPGQRTERMLLAAEHKILVG